MQIRQVQIENFRGIRNFKWFLNGRIVSLIGPNDSTKTTILDAIEFALSPRSNLQVSDADFHNGDVEKPIAIKVTLTEFPKELIAEPDKFGLFVRGIHPVNGVVDDPDDKCEMALTLKLTIDKTLEPVWEIVKDSQGEPKRIGWQDREKLGVTRLGEDVDRHLTWGRGSALSKLTAKSASTTQTFVEVARKARQVVAGAKMPELQEAAKATLDAARFLGADFKDLKPGLDGSGFAMGNSVLGLHEANVPMRLWGLGTKRLVALGIQQSGIGKYSILLLDEIEYGLEPHRIRHLIERLTLTADGKPRTGGQIIFTTHSPTSIIALPVGDLYFVRTKGGETTITQAGKDHLDNLQGVARTQPLAFLGRKLLLCEGATEVGLIRGLMRHWTKEKGGQHPVNVGFVYIDGKGRTAAPACALELKRIGYDVALLADTDEPIEPDANTLNKAGVVPFLWEGKMSTEQRLMVDLPVESVQEIINAAIEEYGPDAINSHVSEFSDKKLAGHLNSFESWLKAGLTETQLRSAIGAAAKAGKFGGKKAGWFKDVTLGIRLGEIVGSAMSNLKGKPTEKLLSALAAWIYG
jgi:energy-coupling factor transporter ATP-binding protein EcfA2